MSNAEGPRCIDLSRLDDLKNPYYRLSGIADYCRLLRHYKGAAEALRKAQRAVTFGYEGWSQVNAKLVEAWRKPCDDYFALLHHLFKAAAPLMPEVIQKLKVLRFGAKPLHYDEKTDWQAFEDDLATILAQTEVLRAKVEGTMPDAASGNDLPSATDLAATPPAQAMPADSANAVADDPGSMAWSDGKKAYPFKSRVLYDLWTVLISARGKRFTYDQLRDRVDRWKGDTTSSDYQTIIRHVKLLRKFWRKANQRNDLADKITTAGGAVGFDVPKN